MDARNILAAGAAALLAFSPLAYCGAVEIKSRDAVKIACLQSGGNWSPSWGGTCKMERGE